MTGPPPVCVALDFDDVGRAREVASAVGPSAGALKIGLTLFTAAGPTFVRELAAEHDVFLDLKLHDIPAQVQGAIRGIADLGVAMTTVHAAGGRAMLTAAAEAAPDTLAVLAVTVLTSLGGFDLTEIGMAFNEEDTVLRLADLAISCGVDGLVCSPLEVGALRKRFGPRESGGPLLVVPGIRPEGSASDDQKRTMSPRSALEAGADLLVIGRPITAASDPAGAARQVLQSV